MAEIWDTLDSDDRAQLQALPTSKAALSGVTMAAHITVDNRLACTHTCSFQPPRGAAQTPSAIYNADSNPDCLQHDAQEFPLHLHEGAPRLFEHLKSLVQSSFR